MIAKIEEISPSDTYEACRTLLQNNYGLDIEKLTNCDILDLMNILATTQRARAELRFGV